MIALSLRDCKIKITFYRHELHTARQSLAYMQKPDVIEEKRLKEETKQYQVAARGAKTQFEKELYLDLAKYAKGELRYLPQYMRDEELAAVKAKRQEQIRRYQAKLAEAIDEFEALQLTPEVFDDIRAEYADLPPHIQGKAFVVLDNGTVLTDRLEVATGAEIDLYRVRKVFGEGEVVDG